MTKWLPVPGYEGLYEVSSSGDVRSLDRDMKDRRGNLYRRRGKTLAQTKRRYFSLPLSRDGKCKTHSVHVLVCAAFKGPRPDGHVARHKNGNSQDNRSDNLEWGTPKQNMADQYAHGTRIIGAAVANAKLDENKVRQIRQLYASGMRQGEIGRIVGVLQPAVSAVVSGARWGHVR